MSAAFGGTRSTFGSQVASRRKSSPSYGFGSGTRDNRAKVFVSQEHAKLSPAFVCSPGPAAPYSRRAAVGAQTESTSRSAPNYGFGTSNRFMQNDKHGPPGPGAYGTTQSVGVQVSSKKSSSPLFGFGSSTRDQVNKVYMSEEQNKAMYGHGSPGPMAGYQIRASVGKQVCGCAGKATV